MGSLPYVETYDVVNFPRDAPVQRSMAIADVNPTSTSLKVRFLALVSILITTTRKRSVLNIQSIIGVLNLDALTTVDPSERGPAHTS